jgi:glycerophosphoryl diester phosphodiesterase
MKKHFVIIFLFISFISCENEEFSIVNLNGNKITALGHGGMGIGSTYPMDSFESITLCLSLGMDGSEMDVQMTKDSVLVAYHDNELTGNTTLSGIINSKSWKEIQQARYTQKPYLGYSLVSLDQLFAGTKNLHNYKFTFDCKLIQDRNTSNFVNSYINALIAIVQKYHLENNVYIESQSALFLSVLKGKMPELKLFIYPESFDSGLKTALELGICGITISTRDITSEQIKEAHNNNLMVAIWNTLSESDNIDAIKKNPDFIQTDKVRNLIKLLK